MIKSQVGRRYSKAIFDIAEEKNQVKEIYELLNSAMVLYRTDKEFKNFIIAAEKLRNNLAHGNSSDEIANTKLNFKRLLEDYKKFCIKDDILGVSA